jgi:hypothetical protein
MKFANTSFWVASVIAAIMVPWAARDFLFGMSQGFPVFDVHALLLAAVIWPPGLFCRRYFS